MNWLYIIMQIIFCLAFALTAYTYFIYPLLLIILVRICPKIWKKDENHLPSVSMIIPAYNEEHCIADKLDNCLELDYPKEKIEFIIVSDCSSDRTNEIVSTYIDKGFRLNDLKERGGKVVALNKTIPLANGEIVIFSDANSMYDKLAIRNLTRHFIDERIGCVCGRLIYTDPTKTLVGEGESLYWRYETSLKKLESRFNSLIGANGSIFAIRKDLYVPLPGLSIDDFETPLWIYKKGYKVIYEPEATCSEYTSTKTADEWDRRSRIIALELHSLSRLMDLLNPFTLMGFEIISHKLLRWLVPFNLIAMLISNIILWNLPFYNIILILQGIFYLFSLIGYIMQELGMKKIKFFYIPFYFVAMNSAIIYAIIRFVNKRVEAHWETLER